MFTIGKRVKFQLFFYHNPSHKEIYSRIESDNSETRTATEHLMRIFSSRVDGSLGTKKIENELDTYGIVTLKEFFMQFPSAWEELKRKINKHKSHSKGRWYIDNDSEEEILTVFLRLGRQDGIGDKIESAFRSEIFGNSNLISQISREPSLLDSSHGSLHFLAMKKRKAFIEHIIRHGIQSNIDTPGLSIDKEIGHILPQVLHYLKSIFHIDYTEQLRNIRSVRSLAEFIVEHIWGFGEQGLEAKKCWMLVKAFSAWGGLREIDDIRENALEQAQHFGETLQEHGMSLFSVNTTLEGVAGGETIDIHTGLIGLKLQSGGYYHCKIEYRVKSMRSILLKLWENEDYNNIDAMKDIFGVALILPKDTSIEVKTEIMRKFSQLMANKGYIVKNKGLIEESEMKGVRRMLNDQPKKPLGKVVQKKKGKSAKEFRNMSITGFTTIFGDPQGMEVQFHEQDSYDFWKYDHNLFDPLKVVSAWSRGSWFFTPHQILHVIRNEIPADILETVLRKRPQEIILDYIRRGKIIPYQGENKDVYFTTEDQEEKFSSKFRQASKIDKNDPAFIDFIDTLTLMGVAQAKFGTSSRPHVRGLGSKVKI